MYLLFWRILVFLSLSLSLLPCAPYLRSLLAHYFESITGQDKRALFELL